MREQFEFTPMGLLLNEHCVWKYCVSPVAVYTPCLVTDEAAFWTAVDKVPGRYVLYQPVDS